MALTAVSVQCGQSGGEGDNLTKQPLFGQIYWEDRPASGVASLAAPANGASFKVFRVFTLKNIFFAIGTNPDPTQNPRGYLPAMSSAAEMADIYVPSGAKFAWVEDT